MPGTLYSIYNVLNIAVWLQRSLQAHKVQTVAILLTVYILKLELCSYNVSSLVVEHLQRLASEELKVYMKSWNHVAAMFHPLLYSVSHKRIPRLEIQLQIKLMN